MLFDAALCDGQTSAEPQVCQVQPPSQEHILIIDDDQDQTLALAHRFKKQGYRVTVKGNCAQGHAAARSLKPDLILLDIRLPDGDGLDACSEFCDNAETADIPVLIVSGVDNQDVVRQARSVGCHYFVRKPYDPNALLALVQTAISESKDW